MLNLSLPKNGIIIILQNQRCSSCRLSTFLRLSQLLKSNILPKTFLLSKNDSTLINIISTIPNKVVLFDTENIRKDYGACKTCPFWLACKTCPFWLACVLTGTAPFCNQNNRSLHFLQVRESSISHSGNVSTGCFESCRFKMHWRFPLMNKWTRFDSPDLPHTVSRGSLLN